MNQEEKNQALRNKAVRGYIIRSLVKGFNNKAIVRQIANALMSSGMIVSPDLGKYLDYLEEAGYIEFVDEKVKAYTAYVDDAVIKLTKLGVDLAEGTIEDNGVDILWEKKGQETGYHRRSQNSRQSSV